MSQQKELQTTNASVRYKFIKDPHEDGVNGIAGTTILEQQEVIVTKKSDRNHPPCSVINVVKTMAAYLAFFGAGMGNSIFGATILQLQDQTTSTPNQIASIFTWRALGSMGGNLVVAILFDKIPPEVILCLGCFVLASATVAVPLCTSFVALTVVIVINGFSHGTLGGGCNSYVVKTWRLKSPPFLQALHFITSFGSCISPLIVDAFVTDIYHTDLDGNDTSSIDNYTANAVVISQYMYQTTPSISSLNVTTLTGLPETTGLPDSNVTELFYPFIITAIFIAIASISFAGALIMDILRFNRRRGITREDSFLKQQKEDVGPITHKCILAFMFIFLIIYGGMECTYGAWIVAFCIKYLNTPFETAALICTSYWASLAGGRAISIITTKIFSPGFLICVCLVISSAALVVLTLACTLHIAVMWVCSILIGVSFSPIFGSCIAFSQQELNVSGKVTTLFVLCLYFGFMGMPALVGFLFVNYTPMCFLYVLSSGAVLIACIFFGIEIYKHLSI